MRSLEKHYDAKRCPSGQGLKGLNALGPMALAAN